MEEFILVTVTVTAQRVPPSEMPSPMKHGAACETDFFEKEGGTHPFTMAVKEAMERAGISTDEGCFITFQSEKGLPLLSVPMKQGRSR